MKTEKTYNVLNYSTSPVAIAINRYDTVLVDGASEGEPSSYPLTLDEIVYVNNATKAIKSGMLRFEENEQAELYEACRIRNWQDILTVEQIESILSNPTLEDIQRILSISDSMYFNRIYGIFIGLRNAGVRLSSKIEQVMSLRYKELANGQSKTNIVLSPTNDETSQNDERDKKIKDLEQEIAALKALMLTKNNTDENISNISIKEDIKEETEEISKEIKKSSTSKQTTTNATKPRRSNTTTSNKK